MPDISGPVVKSLHWGLWLFKNCEIEHRNQRNNGVRAPYDCKPAKLSTRFRRPLTPPPSSSSHPDSTSLSSFFQPKHPKQNEQFASPLFSKLLAELRIMIWKICLGTGVHLTWENGHMQSFSCSLKPPAHYDFGSLWYCDHERRSREKRRRQGDPDMPDGRIGLVLSCRRIYTETVNMMYSEPLFDFSYTIYCLTNLSSLILPHRMHAITALVYEWNCRRRVPCLGQPAKKMGHFTQVWVATWDMLASMQGLKYLKVEIILDEPIKSAWLKEEEKIMQSLEGVRGRGLETLELFGLPFESMKREGNMQRRTRTVEVEEFDIEALVYRTVM